jgi:hypothetical protein
MSQATVKKLKVTVTGGSHFLANLPTDISETVSLTGPCRFWYSEDTLTPEAQCRWLHYGNWKIHWLWEPRPRPSGFYYSAPPHPPPQEPPLSEPQNPTYGKLLTEGILYFNKLTIVYQTTLHYSKDCIWFKPLHTVQCCIVQYHVLEVATIFYLNYMLTS